jgi:hypothetical protein
LGRLFDEVRAGNLRNYFAYWERLIAWSADCTTQIAEFRKQATEKISSRLSAFASSAKLASFLIDAPLFSQVQLLKKLHLSEKLAQRYIESLCKDRIIEPHPCPNDARTFRCLIALDYWRKSMENTALTSRQLLPD